MPETLFDLIMEYGRCHFHSGLPSDAEVHPSGVMVIQGCGDQKPRNHRFMAEGDEVLGKIIKEINRKEGTTEVAVKVPRCDKCFHWGRYDDEERWVKKHIDKNSEERVMRPCMIKHPYQGSNCTRGNGPQTPEQKDFARYDWSFADGGTDKYFGWVCPSFNEFFLHRDDQGNLVKLWANRIAENLVNLINRNPEFETIKINFIKGEPTMKENSYALKCPHCGGTRLENRTTFDPKNTKTLRGNQFMDTLNPVNLVPSLNFPCPDCGNAPMHDFGVFTVIDKVGGKTIKVGKLDKAAKEAHEIAAAEHAKRREDRIAAGAEGNEGAGDPEYTEKGLMKLKQDALREICDDIKVVFNDKMTEAELAGLILDEQDKD